VPTLDAAAEELIARVEGLDSEIEESRHTLRELRDGMETTAREVESDWVALGGAVASLREALRQESERLEESVQGALQALIDAGQAVRDGGSQSRSELAQAEADLGTLRRHASGLDPAVESLVAERGEATPRDLAARAQAVEQELAGVLEDARGFLLDELSAALNELAAEIGERCRAVRASVEEQARQRLEACLDDWEAKVGELEAHVAEHGFMASHSHARAVVGWTLAACTTACFSHLEEVHALLGVSVRPLQELAGELRRVGESLVGAEGVSLVAELDEARRSMAGALSALDEAKATLASYTFVGM
jgi:chromosome segregation ATPase